MSRIGKQPVKVPKDVKVVINNKNIDLKGPKGSLNLNIHPGIIAEYAQEKQQIQLKRTSDEKRFKALHGLTRALIANMITGVAKGFAKDIEIVGLGYNAKVQGSALILSLGFSHPVKMEIPKDIKVEVTNPTNPAKLTVSGIDKQRVGQFSALIRAKKPSEPYKGMGIKYAGEVIRRKAGKALASGG
ncbi:MAG: 50S ribosomal protein L6 [Candidatus Kuenenia sp.]|nr:50S ribosomal protein L6 [Candidatus Kuenenia hertensis]